MFRKKLRNLQVVTHLKLIFTQDYVSSIKKERRSSERNREAAAQTIFSLSWEHCVFLLPAPHVYIALGAEKYNDNPTDKPL